MRHGRAQLVVLPVAVLVVHSQHAGRLVIHALLLGLLHLFGAEAKFEVHILSRWQHRRRHPAERLHRRRLHRPQVVRQLREGGLDGEDVEESGGVAGEGDGHAVEVGEGDVADEGGVGGGVVAAPDRPPQRIREVGLEVGRLGLRRKVEFDRFRVEVRRGSVRMEGAVEASFESPVLALPHRQSQFAVGRVHSLRAQQKAALEGGALVEEGQSETRRLPRLDHALGGLHLEGRLRRSVAVKLPIHRHRLALLVHRQPIHSNLSLRVRTVHEHLPVDLHI
mmetsp:Transcript_37357/g.66896  ORF Transcript_37357/g.66896 Transcript_37357/m.66896 type:complete len:279 (-) Transcript_37357:1056-1892(-)